MQCLAFWKQMDCMALVSGGLLAGVDLLMI